MVRFVSRSASANSPGYLPYGARAAAVSGKKLFTWQNIDYARRRGGGQCTGGYVYGDPHKAGIGRVDGVRPCGYSEYAGICNPAVSRRTHRRGVGGMHLLEARDEQLDWTANKLKAMGVQYFLGAHCTGLNSVYRVREVTGMTKENCLVGTVGTTFDIDLGIKTGGLK